MSSDLSDLYQEVVLEHSKRPRNYRVVEGHNREAAGHNPLCGDQLFLTLKVEGDVIRDVGFQGQGCAISKASASLMTGAVKDKTRAEAEALFEQVHKLVTEGPEGGAERRLPNAHMITGVTHSRMAITPSAAATGLEKNTRKLPSAVESVWMNRSSSGTPSRIPSTTGPVGTSLRSRTKPSRPIAPITAMSK